jgi:formate-dependent nitrite reductase membrane component NrfD
VFWLAAVARFSLATSILLWPTVLVGFCAAAYTAFLFGQCEGRDLWQTPLLPAHLIVQALLCGSAVLALLPDSIGGSAQALSFAVPMLIISLGLHLLMLLGEVAMPHTTDNARYAARLMTRGPFANAFWGGAVVAGGLIPLVLLFCSSWFGASARIATDGASVLALVGLLIFEWCFVMAGQSVPNS